MQDRAGALRQTGLRCVNTENVPSDQKSSTLKLPVTVHAAVHPSTSVSLSSEAVITPPNSHNRKSKHTVLVAEEDSGYMELIK